MQNQEKESATSASTTLSVYDRANLESVNLYPEVLLAVAAFPVGGLLALIFTDPAISLDLKIDLNFLLVLSVSAYLLTSTLVPYISSRIITKLHGIDICKRGLKGPNDNQPVPESCGLASGSVFLLSIASFMFIHCLKPVHSQSLVDYNAALSCISFAILLGISDDLLDIKWKHKIPISACMSFPLILSYMSHYAPSTSLLLPFSLSALPLDVINSSFLSSLLNIHIDPAQPQLVDLGHLFYLYILLIVIFCTNSINIYAGINGLEIGQVLVISLSISLINMIEILQNNELHNHFFSLSLSLPFLATSLALLKFNFYPARVFVGDVFPYYAGIYLAVCSVLGHFSKTLLLLMLPQLFNFVYSLPQLLHLVPCPRHRLPKINLDTGFLESSKVAPESTRSNMTLLCLVLDVFGPMHERTLCVVLMLIQVVCNGLGIWVRYCVYG